METEEDEDFWAQGAWQDTEKDDCQLYSSPNETDTDSVDSDFWDSEPSSDEDTVEVKPEKVYSFTNSHPSHTPTEIMNCQLSLMQHDTPIMRTQNDNNTCTIGH